MTDIYDYRCTLTLLLLEMTRYVAGMDLPADRGPCPLQRVYAVPTRPDLGPLMDKLGARYCTSYNSTEQSAPIANEGMAPVRRVRRAGSAPGPRSASSTATAGTWHPGRSASS